MLIYVKEETLRVIFQPNFSILGTQGSSYRVIRTAKVGRTGSKIIVFCNFRALNKGGGQPYLNLLLPPASK